jgi:GTPase SAR1 family protein
VNVAVAGNMGSGKSTLIGVLSTGQYDNGKGSARTQVISIFMNHDDDGGGGDDDDDDDCTIIMYDFKILMYHDI